MKTAGIDIPLLAVGGIRPEDVEPLIEAQVYGIAVSAAINLATDPDEALKSFYNKLY
jgi:thiamine-phosphate pyrophosphorylase